MSAGDLAAVVVVLVAVAAIVVLALATASLVRTLRELRGTVDELRAQALPLLTDLRATVVDAGAEVERVDALLDAAEAISARVDSASRLGYLAFRAPLIRFVAFWRGVGRGLGRLVGLGRRQRSRAA
ncbi:MAG: DUF948 domain-containing protein [Acidimicrobiales bacterium]